MPTQTQPQPTQSNIPAPFMSPPTEPPVAASPPPADTPPPADETPPDPKETTKKVHELAKKHSAARTEMKKKHTKAVRAAKTPAEAATVSAANAEEATALDTEQNKEWQEADPKGVAPDIYNGLDLQEAVAALHAELSDMAAENNIEVSDLRNFGLEFDVFDPVTGMVVSPARAHRRDVGDAGQLMTADAVISDIISARQHQKTAGVTQYSADRTAVA